MTRNGLSGRDLADIGSEVVRARVFAALWMLAGMISIALLASDAHPAHSRLTVAVAAVCVVISVTSLALGRRLSRPAIVGLSLMSPVTFTLGAWTGGQAEVDSGAVGFSYLVGAMFVAYYLPPRVTAAYAVASLGLYGAYLSLEAPPQVARLRFIGTSLVLIGLALTLIRLRRQVARLVEELDREAQSDPLTGLLNRRGFAAAAEREAARAHRAGQPVALLVIDIDYFKRLNDTYGHAAGDGVLSSLAQVLREQFRAEELITRRGGEEFAVLMVGVDEATALGIAERTRRAVAAMPSVSPVTVSIGVRVHTAGDRPVEVESALADADEALYAAKRAGRNRVELARGPKAGGPLLTV